MNQVVLGTEFAQSTWTYPMIPDQKTCADLSFSDGKEKKIMENMLTLVSITLNEGKFFAIVFF